MNYSMNEINNKIAAVNNNNKINNKIAAVADFIKLKKEPLNM